MAEVNGISATIETNKGNIRLTLFSDKAPLTVANFVNLANGFKMRSDETLPMVFATGF